MDTEKNDPFAWRSGGGHWKIGDDESDTISAMITAGDSFLIVMRKSVHAMLLADRIDPERTNPKIPNSQQKILSYGSDSPLVGRTLLQAKNLFDEHALPKSVDSSKALTIALDFLKEIVVLHELETTYTAEETEKNSSFDGKTGEDRSLHIPSIPNIEQQVKTFVINADHAARHCIEIAQLFYPEIPNKKWSDHLRKKFEEKEGPDARGAKFAESIGSWLWLMRNLRNAIEHPEPGNKIEIRNYALAKTGEVKPPTISYANEDTPLPEMLISQFMASTTEALLMCFETLMAYLCDAHAQPFAGDVRSVVALDPADRRAPHETHVRFGYHIAWTR